MHRYLFPTALLLALGASCLFGSNPDALSATSQATGQGGTVEGTIVDPDAAAIAGTSVALTNGVTSYNQVVKTGSDGSFRFANVPPNTYVLQVEQPGLSEVYSDDQCADASSDWKQKVQLALAGTQQTCNRRGDPGHS